MTPSEIVIQRLTEQCKEIADSLSMAEHPCFRLLSAVGQGDITQAYREGLRGDLAECRRDLACWQA